MILTVLGPLTRLFQLGGRPDYPALNALVALIIAFLLIPILRKALARMSKADRLLLGGLVLWGFLLRLLLPRPCILGAWDYSRTYFYERLLGGFLDILPVTMPYTVTYFDAVFAYNLTLGTLTIITTYLHVRAWFGDTRMALLGAALMATLPSHIKFSASTVFFITSVFWNSLAFVSLHEYFKAKNRIFAFFCGATFLLVFYENFFTRYLNVFYFPLYGLAMWWLYREKVRENPRHWILISLYGAIGTVLGLSYTLNAQTGFFLEQSILLRLYRTVAWFFLPGAHGTLNLFTTPPWIVGAALFGGYVMWREHRPSAKLLITWYMMFYVAHSVVVTWVPVNQARYALHMASPLLVLAVYGAMRIPRVPKPFQVWLGVALLTPFIYWGFITDYGHTRFREFHMLREHVHRIPDGATVYELNPMAPTHFEWRMETFARELDFSKRRMVSRFETIEIDSLNDLPPAGEGVGKYIMLPYTCSTYEPAEDWDNPLCAEARGRWELEAVVEGVWPTRYHDPAHYAGKAAVIRPGELPEFQARSGLYHIVGVAEGADSGE